MKQRRNVREHSSQVLSAPNVLQRQEAAGLLVFSLLEGALDPEVL
jgi:hypothetical protein